MTPGLAPPALLPADYPLDARFKFFALSQTIHIRKSNGELALCVKQKAFKLREDIRVFADEAQTLPLFTIMADRIIDWSASYTATAENGATVCTVRRKGARSLWRATYEIVVGGEIVATVTEKNPWTKVWDGILREIPILGLASAYLFHPVYVVRTPEGAELMTATKQPSLIEGRFRIDAAPPPPASLERPALVGVLMTLLLERTRG